MIEVRPVFVISVLLELSRRMHVIVLTHHAHVGDLASELGGVQAMRRVA